MAQRSTIDIIWPFVRIGTTGLVLSAVISQLIRSVQRAVAAETEYARTLVGAVPRLPR